MYPDRTAPSIPGLLKFLSTFSINLAILLAILDTTAVWCPNVSRNYGVSIIQRKRITTS